MITDKQLLIDCRKMVAAYFSSPYDDEANELLARLDAALAQPEAQGEAVAWQSRWIDPEEGPSLWSECRESDIETLRRAGHEIRSLYPHSPQQQARVTTDELIQIALDAELPNGETVRTYLCRVPEETHRHIVRTVIEALADQLTGGEV